MHQLNSVLPDIYIYNPSCDFAIANGNANWQPNKTLQKMENDMATLPVFFSQKQDVVLVDKYPDETFVESFRQLDFELPGFVMKNEILKSFRFANESINSLIPWGWSPAAHKMLAPLKPFCSSHFQKSPVFQWLPEHRNISSRKFASEILHDISHYLPAKWIPDKTRFPKICFSKPDVEMAISSWGKIMLKAPWSSSGRGLQPITKLPVHEKVWEKVNAIIADQGFVMAEPLLNKIHDMAFLFKSENRKCSFIGTSHFFTNSKGQYEGNWLNGLPCTFDKSVAGFIAEVTTPLVEAISLCIEKSSLADNYEGVFGVDMLIYHEEGGNLKIVPCLEINMRHTMGMVALQIEKLLAPGIKGKFQTFYRSGELFTNFIMQMEEKHPLKTRNGKLVSGFLSLTPSCTKEEFGAYLIL